MNFIETDIPGVWIIEPKVFHDSRGYFMESFQQELFKKHIGDIHFMQDNESCSSKGVLRGLHYQLNPCSQSKLVRVIRGSVLDVAVDLRKGSSTFGRHVAVKLSGENKRQLFVPQGFAHGFHVLEDHTVFTYKVDNPYRADLERSVNFQDPAFRIDWKVESLDQLILSDKDKNAPFLNQAEYNFSI